MEKRREESKFKMSAESIMNEYPSFDLRTEEDLIWYQKICERGGECSGLIKRFDWKRTDLGPFSQWTIEFKHSLCIMLWSKFPMLIWWGEKYILFYNDAALSIIADRHPYSFGRTMAEGWPELTGTVGKLLRNVIATCEPTFVQDAFLPRRIYGVPSENYYTWSNSPIFGRDPTSVSGCFTALMDSTAKIIEERRIQLLQALAARSTHLRNVNETLGFLEEFFINDSKKDITLLCVYELQNRKLVRCSTGNPSSQLHVQIDLDNDSPHYPPGVWKALENH